MLMLGGSDRMESQWSLSTEQASERHGNIPAPSPHAQSPLRHPHLHQNFSIKCSRCTWLRIDDHLIEYSR